MGPSPSCVTTGRRTGMACATVGRAEPHSDGLHCARGRWVVERSFGWIVHWVGWAAAGSRWPLGVSAARIAFAVSLSGIEALLTRGQPKQLHLPLRRFLCERRVENPYDQLFCS